MSDRDRAERGHVHRRTQATMKRGLPLRIETRKLLWGLKSKRWVCDSTRVKGVELQERRDPRKTVVVHPSTKHPGMWQASFFDHHGASSDIQRKTCSEALRETPPEQWRLRSVSRRR